MTFYFKPPRGLIELDKMIECLQQRLQFITSISESDTEVLAPHNITYFVEGTAIDRASHYLLRLASAKSMNFQKHVLQSETALFEKRLHYLDCEHVKKLLRVCQQHCQEIESMRSDIDKNYSNFLISVSNLCQDLLRKPGGLHHAFHHGHSVDCRSMFIRVPYRTCLKLVAERKVDLVKGEAHIPCGVWNHLLVAVFNLHLQYGYHEMVFSGCQSYALQDPRMLQLTSFMEFKFKQMMSNPSILDTKVLTSAKVWEHRKYFPLCINTMLDVLQEHHRLGHHARIALTLFLKEAGMPVQQALEFWRSQYSVPSCSHGPNCSHSWQKDEKKFTYSVRHLYGLEGGRKNYAAPSCSSIQDQLLAPDAVGGCPFARLPETKLIPLLSTDDTSMQGQEVTEEVEMLQSIEAAKPDSCARSELYQQEVRNKILTLANEGKATMACQQLLLSRMSKQEPPNCRCSKPSHFYAICRDWSEQF